MLNSLFPWNLDPVYQKKFKRSEYKIFAVTTKLLKNGFTMSYTYKFPY